MTPELHWLIIIFGGLVGAALGSFAGCALFRLPRGISLLHPPSTCPACGHRLTARELVPIFSFVWQKAHTRCCGKPLPFTYFIIEVLFTIAGGLGASLLVTA